MGSVTHVDFQKARAASAPTQEERIDSFAEAIAAAWYSPAGRVVAAAMVFVVVMIGLGLFVFALDLLMGRP